MARTHAHLKPYQFKKQSSVASSMKSPESNLKSYRVTKGAPAAPSGHREGKPAAGAPVKAQETPISGDHPAHLPPGSQRRAAAIELLMAGSIAAKKPVVQKHHIKVAPTATALKPGH